MLITHLIKEALRKGNQSFLVDHLIENTGNT